VVCCGQKGNHVHIWSVGYAQRHLLDLDVRESPQNSAGINELPKVREALLLLLLVLPPTEVATDKIIGS
jgi:hypothetical protein